MIVPTKKSFLPPRLFWSLLHIFAFMIGYGDDLYSAEPQKPMATNTDQTSTASIGYKVQLDTIAEGFKDVPGYKGAFGWAQARAGIVPRGARDPMIVVTTSPLMLTGSDVYFDLHEFRSKDLGKSWLGPFVHDKTLNRRNGGKIKGVESQICPGDFWPKWHAKSGKILGTGQTMQYTDDKGVVGNRRRQVCYSSYDAENHEWAVWDSIEFPNNPELQYSCGAGCTQRFDLENGDILLPVYYFPNAEDTLYRSVVLRCQFDGKKLKMVERGNDVTLPVKRGAYEPSLTKYGSKYFLTIRNDQSAYVSTSADGVHFDNPHEWTWDDDGTPLGSYNTQAHWVTHSDGLFLVYTRKGANNNEIMRHRAPLFIAEVDPNSLKVIRKSERVLIPKNGSRYGNGGVVHVNKNETWVIECELMQTNKTGKDRKGLVLTKEEAPEAKGRIYAARIIWDKPNEDWNKQ